MNTVINLHGNWRYELDEEDQGVQQGWYLRSLAEDGFTVPGTTTSNKLGDPVHIERKLSKEAVRCLREEKKYLGAAWYQTGFCINQNLKKKRVLLCLERVIFESAIWIEGHFIGKQDSLSTPHIYDITDHITVGSDQVLTIRIDNRDIQKIGPYPSAYTGETQTIWNGIVGRAEIIIEEAISIKNVISGVSIKYKEINLSFDLYNAFEIEEETGLTVRIKDRSRIIAALDQPVTLSKALQRVNMVLPLTEAIILWDEFDPALYTLEIEVYNLKDLGTVFGFYQKQVGFRQINQEDGVLRINDIQRFFRGNIDCCAYPHTGHPPMDLEAWKIIFKKTKAYGLNHVRFHSWCPPEAAFEAADQLGVYLQVEGPVWMDHWTGYTVGCYQEHYRYLPEEAMRIIDTYSSHPSFCIFSNGNELNGDFNLLENIIGRLRDRNPNLLYTLTTNWDRQATRQDDLFIAQSVDGTGIRGQYYLDSLVTGTRLDFTEAVGKRKIPVLSHEVGQYAVYPNVADILKYTGVLKPVNLEAIKNDLEEKGLLSYISGFVEASGKLSWLLYKAEIEAAIRTKGLAGIQLLGLHDFPGQSTATVGILDCFYDSKGIGSEEAFRAFCNETVVLVKLDKFIFKTSEPFIADIEIANYGKKVLGNVYVNVSIEDRNQHTIWTNEFAVGEVPIGLYSNRIHTNVNIFEKLKGRTSLVVKAAIRNTNIRNTWDIWVYEEALLKLPAENSYETLNEEAIHKLRLGENVLILAKPNQIRAIGPSKFFPVFWSPVHFASIDPCGMMIDQKHPLFKTYFPTKAYADHEWKNILENGVSINLDHLAGFRPITMFVPNFYNNHKFSNLLEAKVLNGKVLICSLDPDAKTDECIETAGLKNAIVRYFASSDFNPGQRLELEDLKMLFKVAKSESGLRDNIALNKPAYADSIKSSGYNAGKGNDGNVMSHWSAADAAAGHYWQVDLGKEINITGTKVIFNGEGNYQYVIHTSLEGKNWELVSNQTGQIKTDKARTDHFSCLARYVRITYNGLPIGTWAGHQAFEVYVD